jgi:aerobic-type carbon monoxide dehydrogenase small subunit (CoxS/CutS family)
MIQLTVNGSVKQYDGDPAMPVLWYLRDLLELTGAKFGCGMGLCGACTVHVEGKATRSCVTNMSDVAGKRITTIEGLRSEWRPSSAKSLAGGERAAVRLLSGRPDHAGRVAAGGKAQADGSRYR